jgi:hypothetical protein
VGHKIKKLLGSWDCDSFPGHVLVKIKTMVAVSCFKYDVLKQLSALQIEHLVGYYMAMIEQYDLEEMMLAFKRFICSADDRIVNCVVGIIHGLSRTFHAKIAYNTEKTEANYCANASKDSSIVFVELLEVLCDLISYDHVGIKNAIEEQLVWLLELIFIRN